MSNFKNISVKAARGVALLSLSFITQTSQAHDVFDYSENQRFTTMVQRENYRIIEEANTNKYSSQHIELHISPNFALNPQTKHPYRNYGVEAGNLFTLTYHPKESCEIYLDAHELGDIYRSFEPFSRWTATDFFLISVLHEIGHCANPMEQEKRMDVANRAIDEQISIGLIPKEERDTHVIKLLQHWENNQDAIPNMLEVFADTYAVGIMAKKYDEKKWASLLREWIQFREQTNDKGTSHDTADSLKQLSYTVFKNMSPKQLNDFARHQAENQSLLAILNKTKYNGLSKGGL